ncbi:PP2C family protein-serine/threonine phosphatase [Brotaphodocola sp.]|uniref:PP2C family protein-serine/threonine phosphatase n=1 Tax=Brotaphodocola sp. TaxID=3073577 RepID=UPI003D7DA31A
MVTFSMLSKPGNRENNEDSIGMYQDENRYCFILADGLGGHGKGEVASRLAVDSVIEKFALGREEENFIDGAFARAQDAIIEKQGEDRLYMDMKTTLVVLDIEDEQIQWGHIGDSRLYFFENKKIVERTLDHSVPQMLVAIGQIKEKEIRHHPDRNRLLRVLGTEMDEMKHQKSEEIPRQKNQAFLLCSDGFWELIDERKMESCLKHAKTPEEWLSSMEEIVLKNGKNTDMDNYSAIAVWLE